MVSLTKHARLLSGQQQVPTSRNHRKLTRSRPHQPSQNRFHVSRVRVQQRKLGVVAQNASAVAQQGPSRYSKKLGAFFLRTFQGHTYYIFSFIMPLVTLTSAMCAVYAPSILQYTSSILSFPLLAYVATTQPWSGLISIAASLLTAYYAFGVMPLLDLILGLDLSNPVKSSEQCSLRNGQDTPYRTFLYSYVAFHLASLIGICHLMCTHPAPPLAFFGVAVSCGVAGGILFTVAHELLHGARKLDRLLASAMLAFVFYMHWMDSHLAHHVKVGTEEDPATARSGESLYMFIPRSMYGNLVDGYMWAAAARRRKHVPFWSLRNKVLWWTVCPSMLTFLSYYFYGAAGVTFLLVQAAVAIIMLETVNYIEHYSLTRSKLSNGRYERVQPHHSWNASTIWTNAVTFKLQRHSDHHAQDSKSYELLEYIEDAPQLPYGYPTMMLLSLLPPLFNKVMESRIDEWQSRHTTRVHALAT